MKQIIETKLIEQTTVKFIAKDGKEFTGDQAENQCLIYERRLDFKKVEDAFKRLRPVILPIPFIEWLVGDEYSVDLVTLNNPSDFDTMVDYYSHIDWEKCKNIEEPKTYPTTMIMCVDCDTVIEYQGNLNSMVNDALQTYRELKAVAELKDKTADKQSGKDEEKCL